MSIPKTVKCVYIDLDKGSEGVTLGSEYEVTGEDEDTGGVYILDDDLEPGYLYKNEFKVTDWS